MNTVQNGSHQGNAGAATPAHLSFQISYQQNLTSFASPFGATSMPISTPNKDRKFQSLSDLDIVELFVSAIPSFSDRDIADMADSTISTVKNWRQRKNAPGLAKSMRLAQRVPQLSTAVIEILQMGKAVHRPEALIACLFGALQEIARGQDEVSAYRARHALERFAQIAAGASPAVFKQGD